MSKQIHVSIPEPCHEDWSKMPRTEHGVFCSACSKNVIDFSVKTENEIYEILTTSTGKMCGRFTKMQLQQPIRKSQLNNGFFNWRVIVAAITGFFSFNKVSAQMPVQAANIVAQNNDVSITSKKGGTICIQGKVVDEETNLPIAFAELQLGLSPVVVNADENGGFSFEVSSVDLNRYGNLLVLTAKGYETKQIHVLEFKGGNYIARMLVLQKDIDINKIPAPETVAVQDFSEIMSLPGPVLVTGYENTESSFFTWDGIRYRIASAMKIPYRE